MGRRDTTSIIPGAPGPRVVDVDDISYIVDGSGPDGTLVTDSDDLRSSIKRTLGDYVSSITSVNAYPVDRANDEISVRTESGDPIEIITGGGNAHVFERDLANWNTDFLDERDPSRAVTLGSYFSKGKPKESGHEDGNTLLKGVVGSNVISAGSRGAATVDVVPPTKLQAQISRVLATNRFNPNPGTSPFIEAGRLPDAFAGVHAEMGVYEGDVTDLTYDMIKKVGPSLMLMATGESDGSNDPNDVITGLGGDVSVQVGLRRLSPANMSMRNVNSLRGVDRVGMESDLTADPDARINSSYGQMNSPLTPFAGTIPVNMVNRTVTMVSAFLVAIEGISLFVDGIASAGPAAQSVGALSADILGLTRTRHRWGESVRRGMIIFFGFNRDDVDLFKNKDVNALANGLIGVIRTPGYYATIIRNVTRSINDVGLTIGEIDFRNPVEGVQATVGVIDTIRRSKVIGFLNVCAQIGEIAIDIDLKGHVQGDAGSDTDLIGDSPPSNVPGVVQRPGVAIFKGRSQTGSTSRALAWRNGSSPALMMLPKQIAVAGDNFGSSVDVIRGTIGSRSGNKFKLTDAPRLSSEDVTSIENVIDSEYVPFYFHDLRTNEIVSFHAFIDSLTDSFSPDYVKQEGIGRVEPVMIYKSTSRNIEFSFFVAATSEEDFDEMWMRVNKLITLVYPQWGRGRQVTSAERGMTFTQPFSQIMTASPMIRLRIGDVVRSNYSRFNLARIFGLGRNDFSPGNGVKSTDMSVSYEEEILAIKDKMQAVVKDPNVHGTSGTGYTPGMTAFLRRSTSRGYAVVDASSKISRRLVTHAEIKVKVTARNQDTSKLNKIVDTLGMKKGSHRITYDVEIVDSAADVVALGVTKLTVDHTDLIVDPGFFRPKDSSWNAIINEEFQRLVQDFFDPNKNSIVKSFETISGRGLAGFITQISFDWDPKTIPWETSFGRRAPKVVKVNMSFTPVHDIAPGLDEFGFNRAPTYVVGENVRNISGDVRSNPSENAEAMYNSNMLEISKKTGFTDKGNS